MHPLNSPQTGRLNSFSSTEVWRKSFFFKTLYSHRSDQLVLLKKAQSCSWHEARQERLSYLSQVSWRCSCERVLQPQLCFVTAASPNQKQRFYWSWGGSRPSPYKVMFSQLALWLVQVTRMRWWVSARALIGCRKSQSGGFLTGTHLEVMRWIWSSINQINTDNLINNNK